MEPLISPWFFYWVPLLAALGRVMSGLAIFATAGVLSCLMVEYVITDIPDGERKVAGWWLRWAIPTAVVFFFLALFIPTEKTMYRMFVASHATPDNVAKIVELADGLKDELKSDVVDIIKEVKNDDIQD